MTPVGYIDEFTRYSVSGWAGDINSPLTSVSVIIHLNGEVYQKITMHQVREGLEEVGLATRGIYGFRLYFDAPLSPFQNHEIFAVVEGSDAELLPGKQIVPCVASHNASAVFRPANGILLTTMGRSGSTLLMGLLASHPRIVVGDKPPFEIELLTYYAYLFRNMLASGDHERSLRPDAITHVANRYSIGLNPFFESSFRANFAKSEHFDHFMGDSLPTTLQTAFQKIILDFYEAIAKDQNKTIPSFFAEKALPEIEIQQATRYFFPGIKEIVLVRDLRDVLMSFMQHGKVSFSDAVENISSSSNMILNTKNTRSEQVIFVRYEDLIEHPLETRTKIFSYLNLSDIDKNNVDMLLDLFKGHGTARSPQASIGRWRIDLDKKQLDSCQVFEPFLKAFGYVSEGPTSGIVVSPKLSSARTSIDPAELMLGFESIGENCEFGLVQRRCGAEPLGLLRFASSPYDKLLSALLGRFADMGRADLLEVQVSDNGQEYMVLDRKFGFLFHAWALVGEKSVEEVSQRERRRVPFLVRKLVEDLESGEKIFVYHGMQPLKRQEADRLALALRAYGSSTLLWVELADDLNPAGSVTRLADYLLKGHIDRFAPGENAHDFSRDCWTEICYNAFQLCGKY